MLTTRRKKQRGVKDRAGTAKRAKKLGKQNAKVTATDAPKKAAP